MIPIFCCVFFPLGSNAAVNMEISESVGKMRMVPFHYAVKHCCSAFAESLQTKLQNILLSLRFLVLTNFYCVFILRLGMS